VSEDKTFPSDNLKWQSGWMDLYGMQITAADLDTAGGARLPDIIYGQTKFSTTTTTTSSSSSTTSSSSSSTTN